MPSKKEMLNMNDPEKIMDKDLEKKRVNLMTEFNVSRDEFTKWYVATVSPVVEWTNPVTAWMFAAWVHGSGVEEWITEEEKARREARRAAIAAKKAEREAKEAAAKEVREAAARAAKEAKEAKIAADAAARAATTAKRAAMKKERRSVNEQVNS
jgi:hypothetical protein